MMNISMIGIDHVHAELGIRERFSLTTSHQESLKDLLMQLPGVEGTVILSTCNRTEIYLCTEEGAAFPDIYPVLCRVQGVEEDLRSFFSLREGMEAVRHLFILSAGLDSRILGEDQIISQIRNAASKAREWGCLNKVLDVLFRMAVTAGKKIRTEIRFDKGNHSAIHEAIDRLIQKGYEFEGKTCLVIGNGEMGKLSANLLKEKGADVTVTVRQYKSGVVQIPENCSRINYGERYEKIPFCDYVVSATSSPNTTVTREEVEKLAGDHKIVFIDLAVPRDIDPGVGELPMAELYDIDYFGADSRSAEMEEQVREAEALLQAEMDEFVTWYECRDLVPRISALGKLAAEDMNWRLGRVYKEEKLDEKTRKAVEAGVLDAASKVVSKLLFRLRDQVDTEVLRLCLDALEEKE